MANVQTYSKALVLLNGTLLAEEASVSVRRSTGAQKVMTTAKGWAGMSLGAPMIEIDVSSAVPSADFEVDPGRFMKTLEIVELTVVAAGKQLTSKGIINEDSFKHSVNAESTLEFKFEGQYADWE